MSDVRRGDMIEMRSRMWVASALAGALAALALSAPDPLASRLEELARTAETELSKAIELADVAIDPASAAA